MRVLVAKDDAAGYWRFPWLRYKGGCSLVWKPPIVAAGLLLSHPDLRLPFIQPAKDATAEVYYPLESDGALSREFAGLHDPDGALAFASQFGLLGLEDVPRYRGHRKELDANGEDVNDWLSEAARVGELYEVWDLVSSANETGLQKLITWTPQGTPVVVPKAGRPPQGRDGPARAQLKLEQVVLMAKRFIVKRVNQEMIGMASPTLLLDNWGNVRVHNTPTSLLAALWLEFLEFASGARRQIVCDICGRWMDVTQHRKDKRVHSSCLEREKKARYRERKKGNGSKKTR
ncbi:MAG: hypothetical protein ABSC08_00960 [Bryobacteraceae bacterium]|jgi:hypothetical protein